MPRRNRPMKCAAFDAASSSARGELETLVDWAKRQAKPSKYRNKKVCIRDQKFDSRGEALRWMVLKSDEAAGRITNFKRQHRFSLLGALGTHVTYYVADFSYERDGKFCVEDWKGMRTESFELKEKLFKQTFPDYEFIVSGPNVKRRSKKKTKVTYARAAQ